MRRSTSRCRASCSSCEAIGGPKPVIGVSGGLDSTPRALLVIARAMDRMGRPRSDILAYTMPGFATSDHTKSNAIALAESIGASIETIDIRDAATELLTKIKHPFADGEPVHDITFENVQAGLRTDYLFRLANQNGGLVIGTSDLSELALGWATYGVGDQMSHYAVNTGIPKTLIQHVFHPLGDRRPFGRAERPREGRPAVGARHRDQPELVPAGQDGKMQSTQDRIGSPPSTTSPCSTSCATDCDPRRSPSSPSARGRTRMPEPGRPDSTPKIATPTTFRP